jgi:excisionase family DNA binding protein
MTSTAVSDSSLGSSPEPLFVSAKEAAVLLGLSRSRVYELMNDGTLPSARIGKLRRIPVDALHELANARES